MMPLSLAFEQAGPRLASHSPGAVCFGFLMLKACLTSCAALAVAPFVVVLFAVGCGTTPHEPIVVNRLDDLAEPPEGIVTLRSALASAASGQPIVFDASLDGGVIELSIVGNAHTVLKGEVMGMREEPSGPVSYLVGYYDRDYGRSALYATKKRGHRRLVACVGNHPRLDRR